MEIVRPEMWVDWGVTSELHQLFVLHWDELFDPQTPDTWQVRTGSTKTVLEETIEAIDLSLNHEQYRHNLPYLFKEARAKISFDPIITKHFPSVISYLEKIDPSKKTNQTARDDGKDSEATHINRNATEEDRELLHENVVAQLAEMRKRITVILSQLNSYSDILICEIRLILIEIGDRKRDLYYLTMALAVEWSSRGYSVDHLRSLGHIFRDRSLAFIERFDKAVRLCSGAPAFTCKLAINWPGQLASDTFQDQSISLFTGRPTNEMSSQESSFYSNNPQDKTAIFEIRAFDATSAVRLCEAKLANIFAMVAMFIPNRILDTRGKYALVYDGPTFLTSIRLKRATRSLSRNADDPQSRISTFLKVSLKKEDADQLNSVLQHLRLSMSAATDESQLVNLWIALESLCRRTRGKSIIDSVCNSIVPSVCIGNLRKTVENIARYIQPLWSLRSTEASLQLFRRSTNESLDFSDLLSALLDTKDGPLISEIYKVVGDHVLIRYRVHRTRSSMFRERKQAYNNLVAHRNNVNWQLRRIYRARNRLVHHGYGSPALANLVQHLHTYLIVALYNLVHDLQLNPSWSIPDAMMHRQMLFDHYLETLNRADGPMQVAAILDPSRILQHCEPPFAWSVSEVAAIAVPVNVTLDESSLSKS